MKTPNVSTSYFHMLISQARVPIQTRVHTCTQYTVYTNTKIHRHIHNHTQTEQAKT